MELTERESEVLQLKASGLIDKEIAAVLYLSLHTVRTHIKKALKKNHCKTTYEAVARYVLMNHTPEIQIAA